MWSRTRLVVAVALVASLVAVGCGDEERQPCDQTCQAAFFDCFAQYESCTTICAGGSISCEGIRSGAEKTWGLGPEYCGRCRTAWDAWTSGKDCSEGERKCLKLQLQVCSFYNGRWIWSEPGPCAKDSPAPCVDGSCASCTKAEQCPMGLLDVPMVCYEGKCVQCVTSADCHASLVCKDSKCVGCQSDAECRQERPYCASGLCQECKGNKDCVGKGGKPLCVGRPLRSCTPCTGCKTCGKTLHCPRGSYCAAGYCLQCVTNQNCPADKPLCDGGRCSGCADDRGCTKEQPRCSKGRVCVQCINNSDCPEGEVCIPYLGYCYSL